MALINCPECKRQISDKAPACPQCGCPIGGPAPGQAPRTQQVAPEKPGMGAGCVVAFIFALAVGGFLAFTNPSESDMRKKIAEDGWFPVGFERTNLIIMNWVNVDGATGAKAKYLGIGGGIFKLK